MGGIVLSLDAIARTTRARELWERQALIRRDRGGPTRRGRPLSVAGPRTAYRPGSTVQVVPAIRDMKRRSIA